MLIGITRKNRYIICNEILNEDNRNTDGEDFFWHIKHFEAILGIKYLLLSNDYTVYKVVDEKLFMMAVIKYGIKFERVDEYFV
jgi:microsomal dipeptidase-like Zn-dependent dipeptidase